MSMLVLNESICTVGIHNNKCVYLQSTLTKGRGVVYPAVCNRDPVILQLIADMIQLLKLSNHRYSVLELSSIFYAIFGIAKKFALL